MKTKETFSEHFGMRLTPKMLQRLSAAAQAHNMPVAIFARWVILNYLDELEA